MTGARDHAERLARLRERLRQRGADGFFLPRTDEHGSEYLPPSAERVAWLTGFTGSAAHVVVLLDKAAVFSDGRYTVQLAQEVDEALFERCHSLRHPPSRWLEENFPEGGKLAYDPFLMKRAEVERLRKAVAGRGGSLVPLSPNPLDLVWDDRPAAPIAPVAKLDERWAGESGALKRARIAAEIEKKGADQLLLTGADSIAWLLNIRGADISFNPLCLSFALLSRDGTCRWFVDPRKIPDGLHLDNAVGIEPIEGFLPALDQLGGTRVLVDPAEAHAGYLERLEAAGAKLVEADNPAFHAKAKKNPVEVQGAIDAQRRDGAAVVRFLAWLDRRVREGGEGLDEMAAAEQLLAERSKDPLFQGQSFPAISAHGPNAALPHYHSVPASNRPLTAGTVYLIDSGGQYLDGTTDITRTIALGEVGATGGADEEVRERFTLVLKGHVAIATAVFPEGTTGAQLDTLARLALWRHGLDFDHGTGHGVGAYLCVHEGPQRIAKTGTAALEPGMIVSNEPGYYKPGAYGIRTENLVVVEKRERPPGGERDLFGFRTLTLCPIDRRLIEPALLSADERSWLDAYHARVAEELAPLLDAPERAWLADACRPLG